MTEQEAIDWMVHKAILHHYYDIVVDQKCDDEWKAVVRERVRAIMPYLQRKGLSCLHEAEMILKE